MTSLHHLKIIMNAMPLGYKQNESVIKIQFIGTYHIMIVIDIQYLSIIKIQFQKIVVFELKCPLNRNFAGTICFCFTLVGELPHPSRSP